MKSSLLISEIAEVLEKYNFSVEEFKIDSAENKLHIFISGEEKKFVVSIPEELPEIIKNPESELLNLIKMNNVISSTKKQINNLLSYKTQNQENKESSDSK